MLRGQQAGLAQNFFLYGLSFLLLLEWLMPLPIISYTGFISIFVAVTALFFFITFFQLPIGWSIGLKTIVIIAGLYLMFFDSPLFSSEWLLLIAEDFFF